jgi:hypothetical protein
VADKDTNLALGRPYELSPVPNYALTTDPEDALQLTEGRHAEGGFWTDRAAVGWVGIRPVSITLDLGAVQSISGVTFSSAAGRAGVEWPSAILLFGSVDRRSYSYLGDLVALDLANGEPPESIGFARHTFQTHALGASVRYLRLMIDATGPFVFVDEIEVYGRQGETVQTSPGGMTDTTAFFWRAHAAPLLRATVQRTLHEARERLDSARLASTTRATLRSRLAGLDQDAARLSIDDWWSAKTQYPMNDVHAAALAVIGEIERQEGLPPLRVWAANPWDPLTWTARPGPGTSTRIDLVLMNGEVRAGAFNLRNSSEKPIRATLNLRMGGVPDATWVHVLSVAWTAATDGRPVAAALLPATQVEGGYVVNVPAGATSQVWLSFAPKTLTPGIHGGHLRIRARGRPSVHIELSVRILRHRFPDALRLHVGGWDYLNDRGATSEDPDYLGRIASMLSAYGVDLPWATASAMPVGRYDTLGQMQDQPVTAVFDSWIARWPRASRYRVFVAAGDSLAGLRRGTPAFDAAVAGWAGFWAKHATDRGVAPSNVDLLFVDEPSQPQQAERQIDWARALKASGSGFKVWLDPTYADAAQIPRELLDATDVLCINRHIADRAGSTYWAFARQQKRSGKTVEVYGTDGPATGLDPYAYFRLQAWIAFDVGASASSFWSFTDTGGGDSWREWAAPHMAYAPLFLDGSSVVPGKHLAAILEGAEDFEYLAILRDAVAAATERRPGDPALVEARSCLATAAARVLIASHSGDLAWESAKDRTIADVVRVEIADILERLSAGTAHP